MAILGRNSATYADKVKWLLWVKGEIRDVCWLYANKACLLLQNPASASHRAPRSLRFA